MSGRARKLGPERGGAVESYQQLIRLMRCEAGEVELVLEFEPRFDFGLTTPQIVEVDAGLMSIYGGADALVLQSDFSGHPTLASCAGRRTLRAGEQGSLVLTYAPPHQLRAGRVDLAEVQRRVNVTRRFWAEWSRRCTYEGPYREQVLRSALVIKSLTDAPTGALVAAPTTWLPELVGGGRCAGKSALAWTRRAWTG